MKGNESRKTFRQQNRDMVYFRYLRSHYLSKTERNERYPEILFQAERTKTLLRRHTSSISSRQSFTRTEFWFKRKQFNDAYRRSSWGSTHSTTWDVSFIFLKPFEVRCRSTDLPWNSCVRRIERLSLIIHLSESHKCRIRSISKRCDFSEKVPVTFKMS